MNKLLSFLLTVIFLFVITGCNDATTETPNTLAEDNTDTISQIEESKINNIPFQDEQLYAVAHLGYYEIDDFSFYAENYLDNPDLPIYYISNCEYYLFVPRYTDMETRLYKIDFNTSQKILIYESSESHPFIVQCNQSDIFADFSVEYTYQGETAECSPCISLRDGALQGFDEYGINITK